MNFKKAIRKIHLSLGICSGTVVFIISITGCLYAFQEEIQNFTQPYRFSETDNAPYLLPSKMKEISEGELKGKYAHSVLYPHQGKSAQVIFYNESPNYYYSVYIHPQTGQVLKVKDMNADFFRIVLIGHFYLWLPPAIGQPVVATATLIFVILIVSGLILWWPKKKSGARQRFTIKWNSRWRRRNYDLHNVLGFYIFSLALIFALTGLVWGFEWFAQSVYKVASGGKRMAAYYEPHSDTSATRTHSISAIDQLWYKLIKEYPTSSVEIHFPEEQSGSIAANINPDEKNSYKRDIRYFDQYTLKELEVSHSWGKYKNASPADKLLRMNYDIHVGAIWGLPGKILAFFISLVTASLPVTGFLIWLGRKKKYPQKEMPKLALA